METIDNIRLIDNGLSHIKCELSFDEPSLFRVLRESHTIFYRLMVETLRGTDNFFIAGRNKDKHRKYIFKIGDDDWKEIKKSSVNGCKKAWRYSKPKTCSEPEELESHISDDEWLNQQGWLILFYDALAMVQTQSFMCRLNNSKELDISDEELVNIEWIHENIRNVYEHFVPKLYSSSLSDLRNGVLLLLSKSEFLLYESGNVSYYNHEVLLKIKEKINLLVQQIRG